MAKRLSLSEIDFYVKKKIAEGYKLSYQGKTKVLTRGESIICINHTRNGWATFS